jgi:hypothetical protein
MRWRSPIASFLSSAGRDRRISSLARTAVLGYPPPRRNTSRLTTTEDALAELTEPTPPAPAFEAEYAIESPLRCPHCKETIATIQVLRLVRTRVNFVSLLPRRGYVVVCPACHQILSAELGGGLKSVV